MKTYVCSLLFNGQWVEHEEYKAKSRAPLAEQLKSQYPSGSWKLRLKQ